MMAESMHWFRWHHGSVTDPKFGLIAKRAGASLPEVIALWATILEAASASADRGNHGQIDFEALDFALGLEDGRSAAIHTAMVDRGMIDPGGGIAAWERRQPRREDPTAAARQRKARDRRAKANRHAASRSVTQESAESRSVTQCSDRGEERREEENSPVQENSVCAQKPIACAREDAGARTLAIVNHSPVQVAADPRSPLGRDFEPSADHRATAEFYSLDLPAEVREFVDHARDQGRLSADWPAAFRRWLHESARRKQIATRTGPRGSPPPRHASSSSVENMRRVMDELQEREAAAKAKVAAGGGA